jgi:hypothetical protein
MLLQRARLDFESASAQLVRLYDAGAVLAVSRLRPVELRVDLVEGLVDLLINLLIGDLRQVLSQCALPVTGAWALAGSIVPVFSDRQGSFRRVGSRLPGGLARFCDPGSPRRLIGGFGARPAVRARGDAFSFGSGVIAWRLPVWRS